MNRITIIGRSGADAELRYTKEGNPVLGLSVATSKNTAKYGEPAIWATTWHKVVVWGKTAERIASLVKKGSKLYVDGELQVREWEKDGIKRQSVEINSRTIEVITENKEISSDHPAMREEDIPF